MDERHILSAMVNKTLNNGYFHTAVGREAGLRDLRVILRPSGDQSGRSDLRSNLVNSEVNSGPFLRPISGNLINILNLASFGRR